MAGYQELKARIDRGETIVHDAATSTELQSMGVPLDPIAWSGPSNYTHPSSIIQMHERQIRAGADIITTNTWSTVRPTLERCGYGGMVREINARAVHMAQTARDRAAGDRPVYIAGGISSSITGRDPRTGEVGFGAFSDTLRYPAEELEDYYGEMTEIMAEAGVDFFLIEPASRDNEARIIEAQAAKNTGLPVWVGFNAHVGSDENVILGWPRGPAGEGAVSGQVRSIKENMTLSEAIAEVKPLSPDVMAVFHSRIDNATASLRVMLDEWSGPVMAYPDSGRRDMATRWTDRTMMNEESVDDFTGAAKKWVDMGVQVVGACCGFGVEYIEPLRGALPDKIAQPRIA